MNSLNSVLLEGCLVKDPERVDEKTVCFPIDTLRMFKNNEGDMEKKKIRVNIVVTDRLVEVVLEYLIAGRGVRIVGRLDTSTIIHAGLFVIAENVEFKPENSKVVASAF